MRALDPITLLVVCWGVTVVFAGIALADPWRFDLVQIFMRREALDPAAFTLTGAAWLAVAFAVYVTADRLAAPMLPEVGPAPRIDRDRAALLTFWVNLAMLGVTLAWLWLTARQMGGLAAMARMTLTDSLAARDLLLDNKLFTGMRLFYAALPGTGCLAAALLAQGGLGRAGRRACLGVLALNTLALALLPIVMSQRLLLLQFLLSAYLVACVVRGRLFGLPWLGLGVGLFLAVWIGREAITNPHFQRSAVDLGLQKLVYYFVNDLWNSFAPLAQPISHTFGAVSLRGLTVLSFTDGHVQTLLADRIATLDTIRGGGDFSIFTGPYVDFGPLGGAAFIAGLAVAVRAVFRLGQRRLGWAVAYAQLGAALLFSSHGMYLTHQNLLFSLVVVAVIMRLSQRVRPAEAARPQPLPDALVRQIVVFRTSRRPVPGFRTRRRRFSDA